MRQLERVFIAFSLCVLVLILIVELLPSNDPDLMEDPRLIENFLEASYKPKYKGKSIFFIETKRQDDRVLRLTNRQACCIEAAGKDLRRNVFCLKMIDISTALTNPDSDIFVLFSYEVGFFNSTLMPLVDVLLSYKNVHLAYFNLFEYAKNTPLEQWIQTDTLFNSNYYVQHSSDIFRFLTLWKYTGTYLDLDVIIKQNTSVVGTNFACIQSAGIINSAIMNLDWGIGRSIAEKYFKQVIAHFDGSVFTANGPDMMSKIFKEMCDISNTQGMHRKLCKGFELLPSSSCYAIEYFNYLKFFEEQYLNEVMSKTKNSLAIHFWNFASSWKMLPTQSNAALINIAEQFCPRILSVSGEFF